MSSSLSDDTDRQGLLIKINLQIYRKHSNQATETMNHKLAIPISRRLLNLSEQINEAETSLQNRVTE